MTWANATDAFSSDYNGFRPNKGVRQQLRLAGAEAGQDAYEPKPEDWKTFATLADFRAATGQETHGVEVDFDIFENLAPPDPAKRHAVYHAMDLNFRLKPGSKAVDAGVPIPTVNDGFTGRAPDLGALEVGKPEPKYGPAGSPGSRSIGSLEGGRNVAPSLPSPGEAGPALVEVAGLTDWAQGMGDGSNVSVLPLHPNSCALRALPLSLFMEDVALQLFHPNPALAAGQVILLTYRLARLRDASMRRPQFSRMSSCVSRLLRECGHRPLRRLTAVALCNSQQKPVQSYKQQEQHK